MTAKQGKLANNQAPLCPTCNKVLDGFTSVGDNAKPSDGDVSVCCYCNAINQFVITNGKTTLKTASADVIEQVNFLQLQKANEVVAAVRNKRTTLR